jgi:hypothetical protein
MTHSRIRVLHTNDTQSKLAAGAQIASVAGKAGRHDNSSSERMEGAKERSAGALQLT